MNQLLLNFEKPPPTHPYCAIDQDFEIEELLEKNHSRPSKKNKARKKANSKKTTHRSVVLSKDSSHQNPYTHIGNESYKPLEATGYYNSLSKSKFEKELILTFKNYIPSLSNRLALPKRYKELLVKSVKLNSKKRAEVLNRLIPYQLPVYENSKAGIEKPYFNRENEAIKVVEKIIDSLLDEN